MKPLQELLELGAVSSTDTTKLSESTLSSMVSHIRTLKRNGVDINYESLTMNTVKLLDSLRDTKGRLLNKPYKRQIAMTIKRLYPSADINIKPFAKHEQKPTTRLMSEDFVRVIGTLIERAAKVVRLAYTEEIGNLSVYDTCLAILLTTSTSLRINEVHDLRVSHIASIRADKMIPIRSKGYQNLRSVALNAMLDNVFTAIERQRPKVNAIINREYRNRKHRLRFDSGYVIITSIDFMRKKLREISSGVPGLDARQSFGFNIFRKYITTVLIENGGVQVAQTMNNHSSAATTMDHYNVVSRVAAQKSYDKLFEMMDRIDAGGGSSSSSGRSNVVDKRKIEDANRSTTNDYPIPETPAPQVTDVVMK